MIKIRNTAKQHHNYANGLGYTKHSKIFSYLIAVATLFLGIGYASITGVNLFINGEVEVAEIEEVVIQSVAIYSGNDTSLTTGDGSISFGVITHDMVSANVTLSPYSTNSSSKVTYRVDVFNNSTSVTYGYLRNICGGEYCTNEDIAYTVSSLYDYTSNSAITSLQPKTAGYYYVTFFYDADASGTSSNTSDTYIRYIFTKQHTITYSGFPSGVYYDTTILEGETKTINLDTRYKSLSLQYTSTGNFLLVDTHYTFTSGSSSNTLVLYGENINDDITIYRLTDCTEGENFGNCLIYTNYAAQGNEITSSTTLAEAKSIITAPSSYSVLEPNITWVYSEDNIMPSSSYTTQQFYWGTSFTFDSAKGSFTLGGTTSFDTVANKVSSGGTVYYTMLSQYTHAGSIIYVINGYNTTTHKITSGTRYRGDITKSIYTSKPGLYSIADYASTEEYINGGVNSGSVQTGTSYFYRGLVENNWVNWGGYYWRIVRINGDGSIRMIYSGTAENHEGVYTQNLKVGTADTRTSAFNNKTPGISQIATSIGYMYNPETTTNTSAYTIATYPDPIEYPLNATYNLTRFNRIDSIGQTTNYYFFDDEPVCDEVLGYCTFTCTNYNSGTKQGDNCVRAVWNDIATANYSTDKTIYPEITTYAYRYTSPYKYSCFNLENSSVSGTTVSVKCAVYNEILGVPVVESTRRITAVSRYSGIYSSSYEEMVKNNEDSTIKTYLDDWYSANIYDHENEYGEKLEDYISNEIFCNDRSLAPNNVGTGFNYQRLSISGKLSLYSNTTFNGYYRIGNHIPTTKCYNDYGGTVSTDNDAFTLKSLGGISTVEGTSSFGNEMLDYPIGLITIDELSMSGLRWWLNINTLGYLYTGQNYVDLSPSYIRDERIYAGISSLLSSGYVDISQPTTSRGVRSVLNLKSDVLYKSGSGTVDDPYEIALP